MALMDPPNPLCNEYIVELILEHINSIETLKDLRLVNKAWSEAGRSIIRRINSAEGNYLEFNEEQTLKKFIFLFGKGPLLHDIFKFSPKTQGSSIFDIPFNEFAEVMGWRVKGLLLGEYEIRIVGPKCIKEGHGQWANSIYTVMLSKILYEFFPNLKMIEIQDYKFPRSFKLTNLKNIEKFHYRFTDSGPKMSNQLMRCFPNLNEVCIKSNGGGDKFGVFSTLQSISELGLNVKSFKIESGVFDLDLPSITDWENYMMPNIKFTKLELSINAEYRIYEHMHFYDFCNKNTSLSNTLETFSLSIHLKSDYDSSISIPFGFSNLKTFILDVNNSGPEDFRIPDDMCETIRIMCPVLASLTIMNTQVVLPLTFSGKYKSLKTLKLLNITYQRNESPQAMMKFRSNLSRLSHFVLEPDYDHFDIGNFIVVVLFKLFAQWGSEKYGKKRRYEIDFPKNKSIFDLKSNPNYLGIKYNPSERFYKITDFGYLSGPNGKFNIDRISQLDLRNIPITELPLTFLKNITSEFPCLFKMSLRTETDFDDGLSYANNTKILSAVFDHCASFIEVLNIELDMPVKNIDAVFLGLGKKDFVEMQNEFKEGEGATWLQNNSNRDGSIAKFEKLRVLHMMWNLENYLKTNPTFIGNTKVLNSFFLSDLAFELSFKRVETFEKLKFTVAPVDKFIELNKSIQFLKPNAPLEHFSFSKVTAKGNVHLDYKSESLKSNGFNAFTKSHCINPTSIFTYGDYHDIPEIEINEDRSSDDESGEDEINTFHQP